MIRTFLFALLWSQLSLGGAAQAASLPVTITFQSTAPITLGETTILPPGDTGGNSNLLTGMGPYALSQAGVVQSVSMYIENAVGSLRLGLYSANGPNGRPGTLIAQTASFTPVHGWNTKATTTTPTIQPGNYWLAFTTNSQNQTSRTQSVSGLSEVWYARTYQAMPTTFSTTPAADPRHWSLYATLTPTGPPGPLTVSFNPPSPSIPCEAAPGSVVSTVTAAGGNGGPITWDMTGDTGNFKLSATPSVVTVIVGPSGIVPPSCGTTSTVDVTATQ